MPLNWSHKQAQEQKQNLTMSLNMQQSLDILHMSNTELIDFINREALVNPIIDFVSPPAHIKYSCSGNMYRTSLTKFDPLDISNHKQEKELISDCTLQGTLLDQLSCSNVEAGIRKIAKYIIEALNDNGYLSLSDHEIIDCLKINVDEYNRALSLVQSFEPAGIAANSLSECLLLQLSGKEQNYSLIKKIISDYLPELSAGKHSRISRELKVSEKDVLMAADLIKSLNPKPGVSFDRNEPTLYVYPEIIIEIEHNALKVSLIKENQVSISINSYYNDLLRTVTDAEIKKYLSQNMQKALSLGNQISKRYTTLLECAEIIAVFQNDFFLSNCSDPYPLSLNKIAEQTGLSVSTISRAINNVYTITPRGVFLLKYFFPKSVSAPTTSPTNVQKLIATIVSSESSDAPLSDNAIVKKLEEDGVFVARRTVAKYREELNIPSSALRRK